MKYILCTLLLVWLSFDSIAQQDSIRSNEYIDQTDLAKVLRSKKKPVEVNDGIPEKGKLMSLIVPVFGSNPLMGTFYGIGGTGAIFIGTPESTSISNLNASLLFTTKNQFIGTIKGTIMTPDNNWEILTDIKYAIFSENTFGLGSDYNQVVKESWNVGGVNTTGIEGAQPVKYRQLRFHFTALNQVFDNIFLGIGYHYDRHYKIVDESLDLEAPEPVITSHYAYSVSKGLPTKAYTLSGTSFNIMYDSRDHTVSPYSGSFAHLAYHVKPDFLGSTKDFQFLYLETRFYKQLSKSIPRHLIGLWAIGQFTTNGDAPYLDLAANGYDMRNRIGRGYVAGRFRGPDWITVETEYRFPITRNGLLGGVLFGSATTITRDAFRINTTNFEKLKLFDATRYAAGFGARVMLNRAGRLNLGLDMAFGQNGSKGFYLTVGETF